MKLSVWIIPLLAALALFSVGCNETSFAGSNARRAAPPQEASAEPPTAEPPTATPPRDAVTKGSFTVWTEPSDPEPREDYKILIEVRLPPTVASYTLADLTGFMYGTDQYVQPFGQTAVDSDRETPSMAYAKRQAFSFEPGRALLIVDIPGAERLVRDRIDVGSAVLKERQTLTIVF